MATEHAGAGGPAWSGAEPSKGERSEPARDGATDHAERGGAAPVPDPEVRVGRRRTFSAEYKARILRLADACREPGEIGTLLRREGLYSSHLVMWRRQRAEVEKGLARRRGPKGKSAEARRLEQLAKENAKLRKELSQAQLIIEYQKKVHALLGIPLPPAPGSEGK